MSKKAVILLVLCFFGGVAIALFTDWNPLAMVTGFMDDPLGSVSNLTGIVTQYWGELVAGISGIMGTLMLVSRAYSNTKEKAKETQNVMQGQLLEADKVREKMQGEIEAKQTVITEKNEEITAKEQEISQLKLTVDQLEAHNRRLVEDASHSKKLSRDEVVNLVRQETRKP